MAQTQRVIGLFDSNARRELRMKISAAVAIPERSQVQHSGQIIRKIIERQFLAAHLNGRGDRCIRSPDGRKLIRSGVSPCSHGKAPSRVLIAQFLARCG